VGDVPILTLKEPVMHEVEITAELTAKNGNEAKAATVKAQIGENLEELGSQFTPDVVYSHARRSIIIAMQTSIRGMLEQGKGDDEIQATMHDWKPGLKRPAKSAIDRVRDEFTRMSPEDRKRILKELRDKASQEAKSA
jgi:hypothetical protein